MTDFYHEKNKEVLRKLKSNTNPSSFWNRFVGAYDPGYVKQVIYDEIGKSFPDKDLHWGRINFISENPANERYTTEQRLSQRGGYDDNIPLIGKLSPPYFSFRKPVLTGFVIDEYGERVVESHWDEIPEDLRFVRTTKIEELNIFLRTGFNIANEEEKSTTISDIDGMPLRLHCFKLYSLSR